MNKKKLTKKWDLASIIAALIKLPGIKVDRESFLREQFKNLLPEMIEKIVEEGPVEAGCDREELKKKAKRIIREYTAISTGASIAAAKSRRYCDGSERCRRICSNFMRYPSAWHKS